MNSMSNEFFKLYFQSSFFDDEDGEVLFSLTGKSELEATFLILPPPEVVPSA